MIMMVKTSRFQKGSPAAVEEGGEGRGGGRGEEGGSISRSTLESMASKARSRSREGVAMDEAPRISPGVSSKLQWSTKMWTKLAKLYCDKTLESWVTLPFYLSNRTERSGSQIAESFERHFTTIIKFNVFDCIEARFTHLHVASITSGSFWCLDLCLYVCLFVGIKLEKLYSASCVGKEANPLSKAPLR